jgi:hypothetical protein
LDVCQERRGFRQCVEGLAARANRIALYEKRLMVAKAVSDFGWQACSFEAKPADHSVIDKYINDTAEVDFLFGSDPSAGEVVKKIRDKALQLRLAYTDWKKDSFGEGENYQAFKKIQDDLNDLRLRANDIFQSYLNVG